MPPATITHHTVTWPVATKQGGIEFTGNVLLPGLADWQWHSHLKRMVEEVDGFLEMKRTLLTVKAEKDSRKECVTVSDLMAVYHLS